MGRKETGGSEEVRNFADQALTERNRQQSGGLGSRLSDERCCIAFLLRADALYICRINNDSTNAIKTCKEALHSTSEFDAYHHALLLPNNQIVSCPLESFHGYSTEYSYG